MKWLRGLLAVVVVAVEIGWAASGAWAHGGNLSLIHGCVASSGALRIVPATGTCKSNETPLDWNIAGAPGPAGATGPAGPQGPPGDVFAFTCPPDSVRSGRTCIDTYEASVWGTTDAGVIAKIKDGTVTLAESFRPGPSGGGTGSMTTVSARILAEAAPTSTRCPSPGCPPPAA